MFRPTSRASALLLTVSRRVEMHADGKFCEYDMHDALVSSVDLSEEGVAWALKGEVLTITCPKMSPERAMASFKGILRESGVKPPPVPAVTLEYSVPNLV